MKRKKSELLEKVKELWHAGARQNEIAAKLRISRSSAYRYQKLLGLGAWQGITKKQEKQILDLLQGPRWGISRIAKHLAVSEHQVLLVKRKIKFQRRRGEPGYRYHLSRAQYLSLVCDVLDRVGSGAALARKYHLPHKNVLKLAHALLRCERFLPNCKHPLTSYGPSRPPRPIKKAAPEQHDEATALELRLVDRVCHRFFNGMLPTPALEHGFVEALASVAVPDDEFSPDLNGCKREDVRANFETRLHEAISMLRTAEAAQTSSLVN